MRRAKEKLDKNRYLTALRIVESIISLMLEFSISPLASFPEIIEMMNSILQGVFPESIVILL